MNRFTKKLLGYLPVTYLSGVVGVIVFFLYSIISDSEAEGEVPMSSEDIYSLIGILSLIGLVIFIALCIYGYFYYKTSGYQLTDKEIICVRGVLFKKKSIIEYKKVHAVNQKQGLIQRAFGISMLMVDSGSTNTSTEAEIVIYEEKEVVEQLIYKLKNIDKIKDENVSEDVVEKKEYLYKFSSIRKLIYSSLSVVSSLVMMGIIFIVIIGFAAIFSLGIEDGFTLIDLLLMLVFIYVLVNGLVFITQIIYSFVSLYDFKVEKEQDSLNISYGLFTKINNTFKLNRIKGVKIEQGLVQRLFGFVTIKLEVIGYEHLSGSGNSNDNESAQQVGLLIPLCKMSELNDYLKDILPDYVPAVKNGKAKDFKAFFAMSTIITGIVCVLALMFVAPFSLIINDPMFLLVMSIVIIGIFMILTGCYILYSIFAYSRQSITIDDDKVTIFTGAIHHTTTVIKKENLIAIEDITTYHRAKKGIYTYKIHFHTNALTNVVKVNHLDIELKDKLLNMLKY